MRYLTGHCRQDIELDFDWQGLADPDKACVVHNRQAAIEYALSEAKSGDLVVIAGKGHEQEQIIGQERHPFSDRHVVQRFMQASL